MPPSLHSQPLVCPQVDRLYAGEVGYLAASIKQVADARVGDTITLKRVQATEALAGEGTVWAVRLFDFSIECQSISVGASFQAISCHLHWKQLQTSTLVEF